MRLHPLVALIALAAGVAIVAELAGSASAPSQQPLSAEIERWERMVRDTTSKDPIFRQVRDSAEPGIVRARQALKDDRPLLALHRLAASRTYLAAWAWIGAQPARDSAAFESAWKRMGPTFASAPSPRALEGVEPAAARAIGEAALPQARSYYDASLEYGRNTMADFGLLYLGAAEGQREFPGVVRGLGWKSTKPAPPIRAIDGELAALQSEMLAVYRPPVSIDRHGEFISANSALKEATELNAAGLRCGALLRYLQASARFAPLRTTPPALARPAAETRLKDFGRKLDAAAVDHSIGRLFLETAAAELAGVGPDSTPPVVAAIATDLIPRYLAALEPARPAAAKPAPEVTVTLVRWPYT